MPRLIAILISMPLTLGLIAPAFGEVMEMPESTTSAPASSQESMELPGRGMTMEQVESRFGTPVEKFSAVGEPPITRWQFPDYTVYFEDEYVIHSVAHSAHKVAHTENP